MKRPGIVHFLAIKTNHSIQVRASLSLKDYEFKKKSELSKSMPAFPIQSFSLMAHELFTLKIIGISEDREEIFSKSYDSDSVGNFYFKIPLNETTDKIKTIQVYETSYAPGMDLLIGSYFIYTIQDPKHIIISDFDKTLADTRYSTTSDVYKSLSSPVKVFPTLDKSVEKIKSYIDEGFHPFILTASPHFYEEAIRDWLYQHQVFTAGIFLKDYRHIFSFTVGELQPKDLKTQGLYKMGHLFSILSMTGIPQKLVLMGDNFESDPTIYITLAALLKQSQGPWYIWKKLKNFESFKLSSKQDQYFLSKIYQLENKLNQEKKYREKELAIDIKIFIRKKSDENEVNIPKDYFPELHSLIELYDGYGNVEAKSPEIE